MSLKALRRGSNASASNAEIKSLEDHLAELRKERAIKTMATMKRNEKMIARDAERHARFLQEYKTPEQLEEEQRQRALQELIARLEELVATEDDSRDLLESEEGLETRILLQEHHLGLVCLTLAVVHAEYDRRENQRLIAIEECNRRAKAYDKLLDALKPEEFTARKGIEKSESNGLVELKEAAKKDTQRVIANERHLRERIEAENQHRELALQEVQETKLQQDLEEAEQALATRMHRITANFAAMVIDAQR